MMPTPYRVSVRRFARACGVLVGCATTPTLALVCGYPRVALQSVVWLTFVASCLLVVLGLEASDDDLAWDADPC